jgi:hypothetical protein
MVGVFNANPAIAAASAQRLAALKPRWRASGTGSRSAATRAARLAELAPRQ